MTILNASENERIVSHDPIPLWDAIQRDWAASDQRRWKILACIHLRLHCQWGLDMIGLSFGHHKGHILRLINSGLHRLRDWHAGTVEGSLAEADESEAPYALTLEQIACRRAFYLDEVELWTSLFEAAREESSRRITQHPPLRRIVPDSLREGITAYLQSHGPAHWSEMARQQRKSGRDVRQVLVSCPEFLCDRNELWTVHPFVGQEAAGPDTEQAPPTAAKR